MQKRGILFDLDGTLLDTLDDITSAANVALEHVGATAISRERCRQLVGRGAEWLMREALGPSREEAVPAALSAMRTHYVAHATVATRPYDGIPELLDALVERSIPIAVLSNKMHEAVVDTIAHYFPDVPFAAVRGLREGAPRKPDPTSALVICQALGASPGACAFVGDSEVDIETALRAGVDPVGVSWGFRDVPELVAAGARVVIDRPDEVLELVG